MTPRAAEASIDEPVSLLDYQPAWPAQFAAEHQRISAALKIAPADLEHIGSTAVPGLAAKPTLDLMLGLAAYPPPSEFTARIVQLGYEKLGEAGVPGRLYFRLRGEQSINLHVVRKGDAHWRNNLALRDYLRSSGSARERYARAKATALASGNVTLLAYSTAKAQAVHVLLQEALAHYTG